jgi:hypothetical protein
MQDPIQNTTKAERSRGEAQGVEHLTSKCKALSLNSNNIKKLNGNN